MIYLVNKHFLATHDPVKCPPGPQKQKVKSGDWHLLALGIDGVVRHVIQAPQPAPRIIMRYDVTTHE